MREFAVIYKKLSDVHEIFYISAHSTLVIMSLSLSKITTTATTKILHCCLNTTVLASMSV